MCFYSLLPSRTTLWNKSVPSTPTLKSLGPRKNTKTKVAGLMSNLDSRPLLAEPEKSCKCIYFLRGFLFNNNISPSLTASTIIL